MTAATRVYLGEHRQTLFGMPPDPRRWTWRVAVAVNLHHVYRDYRVRMAGLFARLPRAKDQTKNDQTRRVIRSILPCLPVLGGWIKAKRLMHLRLGGMG